MLRLDVIAFLSMYKEILFCSNFMNIIGNLSVLTTSCMNAKHSEVAISPPSTPHCSLSEDKVSPIYQDST